MVIQNASRWRPGLMNTEHLLISRRRPWRHAKIFTTYMLHQKRYCKKWKSFFFPLHTLAVRNRIEIFTRMWKMFVNNFRTHIPSYHSMISAWTNLYHFFSGIMSIKWRLLFALQFKLLDLMFLSSLVFKKHIFLEFEWLQKICPWQNIAQDLFW